MQTFQHTIMFDIERSQFGIQSNHGFSNQSIQKSNIVTQVMSGKTS